MTVNQNNAIDVQRRNFLGRLGLGLAGVVVAGAGTLHAVRPAVTSKLPAAFPRWDAPSTARAPAAR